MISKIKAACANSLTIAWSYLLGAVGAVAQSLDVIADGLNSPDLKQHISNALGGDVKMVGRIMIGIAIITILARSRSLMLKKP